MQRQFSTRDGDEHSTTSLIFDLQLPGREREREVQLKTRNATSTEDGPIDCGFDGMIVEEDSLSSPTLNHAAFGMRRHRKYPKDAVQGVADVVAVT